MTVVKWVGKRYLFKGYFSYKYVIQPPRHSLLQPDATKLACPPANPATYKIFLSIHNYINALVLTPSVKRNNTNKNFQ